jgi:hypothetical protein
MLMDRSQQPLAADDDTYDDGDDSIYVPSEADDHDYDDDMMITIMTVSRMRWARSSEPRRTQKCKPMLELPKLSTVWGMKE